MAQIPLSRGLVALVDDDDFEWLSQWKWHIQVGSAGSRYARRYADGRHEMMHRVILAPTGELQVDHINGDSLDNRRANLRFATPAENMRNRTKRMVGATSPYKGVHVSGGRIRAALSHNGRTVHLGSFRTHEEAARAYDAAACRLQGEFARPNAI